MSRPLAVALLVVCLLALAVAGVAAGASAEASADAEGDPGELEVQRLDTDGSTIKSYHVDADAGTVNVTEGDGNWDNVAMPNPNETAFAIQLALDHTVSEGETILIGPGTYNGTLTVADAGRTIRGAGTAKTTLAGLPGNTTAIDLSGADTTIADLAIRDYEPGEPNDSYGVRVRSGSNRFANVSVTDVDYGIVLDGVTDNTVENATISRHTFAGVYVTPGATNTTVVDSTLTGHSGSTYGVVSYAERLSVRDSTVTENDVGVSIESRGNHSVIRGNRVTDSSNQGIVVKGSHVRVLDNVVESQRYAGIWAPDGPVDVAIRNNSVTGSMEAAGLLVDGRDLDLENNTVTHNDLAGIRLEGGSGVRVANTTSSHNGEQGIAVVGSVAATIEGVHVENNSAQGIRIAGGSDGSVVATTSTADNDLGGIFVVSSADVLVRDNALESRLQVTDAPGAVVRDNTLIDDWIDVEGASTGFAIVGNAVDGSILGVFVSDADHGTVRDNVLTNASRGVGLGRQTENVSVLDNTLRDNGVALDVYDTSDGRHTIANNTITSNGRGIRVRADENDVVENDVTHSTDEGILVDGGTLNVIADNDVRANNSVGIVLHGVEGNVLERNYASRNYITGIRLTGANQTTVTANVVTGNGDDGMVLDRSHDNTLEENAFVANPSYGLYLLESDRNAVVGNDAARNDLGIAVHRSDWNAFDDNEAHDNEIGIVVAEASDNGFSGTNASANAKTGFLFQIARNNTLTGVVANDNGAYGVALSDGSVDNELDGVTARGNDTTAYTASYAVGGTNRIRDLDVGADAASDVTLDVEAANVSIAAFDGSAGTPNPDLTELGGLVEVTGTTSPIDAKLAFRYTDADVSDLDESSIGLWNHSAGNWTERSDAYHDAGVDAVAVRLTNVSVVGLYAEESSSSSGGFPAPSLPGGSGSDDDGPIELSFHDVEASADRVAPGETVTVTVTVRNEDDRSGTRDLSLADGTTVLDEVRVTLAAGEERRVEFEGEVETAGTYAFALDGEALATVEVAEAASDDADEGDDAANDADGDEQGTEDAGEADDAAAASGGGLGPWVVGVLVVGVAGALAYVRQDQVRAGLAGGRARLAPLGARLAPVGDRLAPLGARLGPLWDRAAPLRERSALLRERLDAFRERRNGRR